MKGKGSSPAFLLAMVWLGAIAWWIPIILGLTRPSRDPISVVAVVLVFVAAALTAFAAWVTWVFAKYRKRLRKED